MKIIILILFLFSFNFTYAGSWDVLDTCEYKWEFEDCMQANKDWDSRSIEDFICISSSNKYEIMPQIILDLEFKKVDKEVEIYLKSLEDNKSEFFGQDAKRSLVEAIDEIESKFSIYDDDSFWKKYMELCWVWIISKTLDCFWASPDVDTTPYFNEDSKRSCKWLLLTKLEVFKSVSYDILKLNKQQIDKDEKKKNTQKRRTKYDKLLEIIMVNVWYMERLRKKWPSKTKYPHKW